MTLPKPGKNEEHSLKWLLGLHLDMVRLKSYGKLTIHYQDGNIERVVREESHRPPSNGDDWQKKS